MLSYLDIYASDEAESFCALNGLKQLVLQLLPRRVARQVQQVKAENKKKTF
jgi:hypothetical protein